MNERFLIENMKIKADQVQILLQRAHDIVKSQARVADSLAIRAAKILVSDNLPEIWNKDKDLVRASVRYIQRLDPVIKKMIEIRILFKEADVGLHSAEVKSLLDIDKNMSFTKATWKMLADFVHDYIERATRQPDLAMRNAISRIEMLAEDHDMNNMTEMITEGTVKDLSGAVRWSDELKQARADSEPPLEWAKPVGRTPAMLASTEKMLDAFIRKLQAEGRPFLENHIDGLQNVLERLDIGQALRQKGDFVGESENRGEYLKVILAKCGFKGVVDKIDEKMNDFQRPQNK